MQYPLKGVHVWHNATGYCILTELVNMRYLRRKIVAVVYFVFKEADVFTKTLYEEPEFQLKYATKYWIRISTWSDYKVEGSKP